MLGVDGVHGLELVHALLAAAINHAFAVKRDDVLVWHAELFDQRDAGEARSAGAVHHNLHVRKLPARQLARIEQTGRCDNRRAVLVVVENRNVEFIAQSTFDDEALGAFNVFEIDAAESRPNIADGGDEFFRVLRRHLDVY